MKKIISVLLAAVMIFSICIIGFAQQDNTQDVEIFESAEALAQGEGEPQGEGEGEPGGEGEGDPDAYHVPPAENPNAVVRLYLCSKLTKGKVGHIFIYAENLTDEPVKVGLITLEKDQGVSMGAFGLQRSDGWGVYYNTESYRFTEVDYSTIIALCEEIEEVQLEKLNQYLQNHNHWDLFINCVFFAVGAWNSCTSRYVFPVFIPVFTRVQLAAKRSRTTLTQMYVPPRENVYYVDGNRSRATLKVCSDESIDR